MRLDPSLLWTWNRTIDRGPYLLTGVVLFLVKFAIDWTIASPGLRPAVVAVQLPGLAERPRGLRVFELGDRGAGVLADHAGTSPAVHLDRGDAHAAPAPGRRAAAQPGPVLLRPRWSTCHPVRRPGVLPTKAEPAPVEPTPPPLPHLRRAHREFVRDSYWRSGLVALAVTVPLAVLAVVLGAQVLQSYGFSLFVGAPFALGMISVLVFGFSPPAAALGVPDRGRRRRVPGRAGHHRHRPGGGHLPHHGRADRLLPGLPRGVGRVHDPGPAVAERPGGGAGALADGRPAGADGGRVGERAGAGRAGGAHRGDDRRAAGAGLAATSSRSRRWPSRTTGSSRPASPTRSGPRSTAPGRGRCGTACSRPGRSSSRSRCGTSRPGCGSAVTDQPEPMREWSPYHIHPPHLDHYLRSRAGRVPAGAAAGRPDAADRDDVVHQPHVAGRVLAPVVGLHHPPHPRPGAGPHQGRWRKHRPGRERTLAGGGAGGYGEADPKARGRRMLEGLWLVHPDEAMCAAFRRPVRAGCRASASSGGGSRTWSRTTASSPPATPSG